MQAPTSGSATSSTMIQINWVALNSTQNGGSAVTSYIAYWDQGNATWTALVGTPSQYLGTTYTVSTDISAGSTYLFKVQA